jgi:hypothetical protein
MPLNTNPETKHTAEPWSHYVTGTGVSHVLSEPYDGGHKYMGQVIATESCNPKAKHDHARIVACVNACAGIENPAEALEQARSIRRAIWELAPLMEQWSAKDRKPLNDLRLALAALNGNGGGK